MFNSTERMESALRDMADYARKYYDLLIEKGFDEGQALQLVLAWQTSMLDMAK